MYLYSLSFGFTLVSFPPIKHVFFLDSLVDYGSCSFGGHSEDYFSKARFCLVEGYVG